MFCVRCGTQNPPEAFYCFKCGAAMLPSGPILPPNPPARPVEFPANRGWQPPNGYPLLPPQPYNYGDYGPAVPIQPAITLAPDSLVLQFHPLAEGTLGLPREIQTEPHLFYSYVNSEGQLIFARRANFTARFGAALLDLALLFVPFVCISGLLSSGSRVTRSFSVSRNTIDQTASAWLILLLLSLGFGYFFFTGIASGQSLGKRALKIRVMRLDGRKPDWFTGLLRYLPGYMLSTNFFALILVILLYSFTNNTGLAVALGILSFGWGFWWCRWDELRQGWHDKLARTLVVDTAEFVEGIHFGRNAPQG